MPRMVAFKLIERITSKERVRYSRPVRWAHYAIIAACIVPIVIVLTLEILIAMANT